MLYAARGLALVISDGRPIPGMSPIVVFLGSGYIGPIPMPVIVVAALAALAIIVTRRLKWGRWIYAVGGDKEAAQGKVYPWTGCLSRCSSSAVSWQGSPGCSRRAGDSMGFPTAGSSRRSHHQLPSSAFRKGDGHQCDRRRAHHRRHPERPEPLEPTSIVYYHSGDGRDRCNSGRARRAQAQARATLPYTPGQGGMRHGDRAGTAGGRRTEVPSSR